MNRPPRKANLHVMDGYAIWRVIFVGNDCPSAPLSLKHGCSRAAIQQNLSVPCCCKPVTAQWFYMLTAAWCGFSLSIGLLANKGIWIVRWCAPRRWLLIIYAPFMQMLFGTEPLPFRYWIITLLIGFAMFLIIEFEKQLTRRWHKNISDCLLFKVISGR